MVLSSPHLRRFVRHSLVAATGAATPDRAQLASAFDMLCDRLRARLHPVFGTAAIAALFARALQLATIEFAWLAGLVPNNGERCSLEGLDPVHSHLDPHTMQEGLAAVLAHEIGLLSTFIGDDLIMPLVEEAWGTASIAERRSRSEGDQ
jgi:hypothetical protein